jgi:hypothetical protein
VPGYLAYAGLVTTWTTLLVFTVKMYTIAGATAQWCELHAPRARGGGARKRRGLCGRAGAEPTVDGRAPGLGILATAPPNAPLPPPPSLPPSATPRYFAPVAQGAPKRATLLSARHALGPSFGSLCLASWLLTLIKYARAALDKMRQVRWRRGRGGARRGGAGQRARARLPASGPGIARRPPSHP